ncbi:glycine cleavage system H protein, mitochondrial [Fukomys damarensis]|uniref:Glycine cleavage system H protein, mitochondrial n=1 Tax=Fukomys damarensis TaxID=885580 RepID=A0A091E505_FUKDA|nr:glycine cleavage system H protein, mitochondrial [Fukomys damarensis]KFO37793.1 Glycine cleavage system H protein, mitochondrial [Fukomys damarensis]
MEVWKFTETHEWITTANATEQRAPATLHRKLWEMFPVVCPRLGQNGKSIDEFGALESVKTASGLHSPLSGEVPEISEALAENPGLVSKPVMKRLADEDDSERPFRTRWVKKPLKKYEKSTED